ncbi:MAG: CBS domain-containing protein [Polyangiales bacterium]
MEQTIRDVLRVKGDAVLSVHPSATVIDAVHLMNEHRVGSVVVADDQQLRGIFSERDVLTRVVAAELDPNSVLVGEVMTTGLYTARIDDTIALVMRMMTERRFRHVPVLEQGRLIGLVSIGDLMKAMHQGLHLEVRALNSYIAGPYMS